ncbi:MAG TPA: 50S ribosomal protein L5 [Thermoprotei archaeon]|nr:50S ribosomal protein L5 [Euryarchaeota archaeon]MCD6158706.1 50S ribosomal protein L5 [Euryarchaeota archaeon]HDJ50936.1 50S ribosomal protein L5 [Thermoprotei archaeon]
MNPEKLKNPMRQIRIEKVVINIGVGEGGERLRKAMTLLERLTGHKPAFTKAKVTNRDFGIRKGLPIGCKVTLRGEDAEKFLKRAFDVLEHKIPRSYFDKYGNFSFGIPDYTLFKDMKYDPDIGIFGMDICVSFERPGYRIKRRKRCKTKVPERHRTTVEEVIQFLKEKFNVEVIE